MVMISFFANFRKPPKVVFFVTALVLAVLPNCGARAQAPPSAPTNLAATPASDSRVGLTWSPSSPGGLPIKVYFVYRGSSASLLPQIAVTINPAYTDNTVSAGDTYYYGVVAADTGGNQSPMSTVLEVTMPTPPAAPANLTATPASDSRVGLNWSAAASGGLTVTYYQVSRGGTPLNLIQIGTVSKTSYSDSTVSAGGKYYYGVQAQDSGGDLSPMSAVIPVTVPVPPGAPGGLAATPTAATRVALSWQTAAGGGLPVAYYQVLRGNSSSTLGQLATVAQTNFTDTTASPGAKYYYGVQAQDTGGDLSPVAGPAGVSVPLPPSAPASVAATPISATVANLAWPPAASGGLPVVFYQVFRGTSPSLLNQVATVAANAFTDTSLTPGTTYYYAVEAEDSGADLSPMSAYAPLTAYVLPSTPSGLATSPASSVPPGAAQATYSVNLSWSASAGGLPILFYQVWRGTSPFGLSQVGTSADTSYTDNSLEPATTYFYALIAADTGGDLSAMSAAVPATTGGGPSAGGFNLLAMTINSFSPSNITLPGIPMIETLTGLQPSVGYQDGTVLNGQTIYFPWQVSNGGSNWVTDINDAIPQSVVLAYNAAGGVSGFGSASNWTYFDLTNLSWYSKGGNQGSNPAPNLPAGFQGGAVGGNMVYPAPIGDQGTGSGGGPYPVLVQYNSLKALDDPTAYETFVPPPMGTTMGNTYGWCTAVYDGRFIYYTPLANSVTGHSGNIFRYDTTQPFSNLTTGGLTAAWKNFDMKTGPHNPGGIDPNAEGFQAVAYDSYRYIYFIPFNATLIVRYDTWNGGSGADPNGFTEAANYVTFNPTQLGTAGYPEVAGQGSAANLAGFTGAKIAWDAGNQNEYLYLVPWGTFPNNAVNPTLQSTAARVRVGTMTGSVWSPVDITSTATAPAGSTPEWEMFDLTLLTQNPAWPTNWPILQDNPTFATQSAMAGWQEAFMTNRNSSGMPFPPRVGFVPDTSQYLVEHDIGHHLYDATGWYVAEVPEGYNFGTMGGGYDATNAILYPSSPNAPLFAFQFQ